MSSRAAFDRRTDISGIMSSHTDEYDEISGGVYGFDLLPIALHSP